VVLPPRRRRGLSAELLAYRAPDAERIEDSSRRAAVVRVVIAVLSLLTASGFGYDL